MALIDVVEHGDKNTGRHSWIRAAERNARRAQKQAARQWASYARLSEDYCDAVPDPRPGGRRRHGLKRGRFLRRWVHGLLLKDQIAEVAAIRKMVRAHIKKNRWVHIDWALTDGIDRLVERGLIIRVGDLLLRPRSESPLREPPTP